MRMLAKKSHDILCCISCVSLWLVLFSVLCNVQLRLFCSFSFTLWGVRILICKIHCDHTLDSISCISALLSCWFQVFQFQVGQDRSFSLLSSRRTRRETITSSTSSVRQLNCPSSRLCSLVSHMCSLHTVHYTRGRQETLWKVVCLTHCRLISVSGWVACFQLVSENFMHPV